MDHVSANGAVIPALGFGTYRMDAAEVLRMIPHAVSVGCRHIDTAQIYDNEAAVGDAIAVCGAARADLFVTTKVWISNYHPDRFKASVEDSLAKLGCDYVDLLLLHWPNDQVPLADQVGALNAALAAGRTRYIGVSNYNTDLMAQAVALSDAPLATNQVEYHPYLGQDAVLAAARAAGLSVTAYYPMAEGKVMDDPVLTAIAADHGKTVPQVVLRWLIQQPDVVALSKTIQEGRASANFDIFDFALTGDEMARIHGLGAAGLRLLNPKGLSPDWD